MKKKSVLYRLKTPVRQIEREKEKEREDLHGHKEKDEIKSISIAN
jgi:hypothetical protein